MPQLEPCEYRINNGPGRLNVCTAGVYGGQVTDGMCRACLRRGDKPRTHMIALGDLAEKALTTIGITKERVERITRKPCGCKARQRWMNQAGFAVQRKAAEIVTKAAKVAGFGR